MNNESPLRATLNDDEGRATLFGMVLFLVLTFVFSVFIGGERKIGFFGGLICSLISLGNGQAFSRRYLQIKDEMEKANKKKK